MNGCCRSPWWMLASVVGGLWATAGFVAAADSFAKHAAPFLKEHCQSCHGAKKQEGGVRLDQLEGQDATNRHLWAMIHEQVAKGEMPPKEREQPAAATKTQFLMWVRTTQRSLDLGRTRRLNRRELSAALRDVTGLPIDFSSSLPGDGTVGGFDTGAEGLPEAAEAVAQWLQLTRRAVDALRFREEPTAKTFTASLRESKDPKKVFDAWRSDGVSTKAQGIARPNMGLLIEPRAVGERDEFSISVPVHDAHQGMLRVTVVVSALLPFEKIPRPRLWVRIGGKDLDYREIKGTFEQPEELTYYVQLADLAIQSKGVNISLSNKVEIPYAVEGFENEDRSNPKEPVPGGTGLYRPSFDRKTLPPEKQPAPYILLQRLTIEPDTVSPWPPAHWNAKIGPINDDEASAQRLLALWMERAWRRPTTPAEQEPFRKLYAKLRAEGTAFDPALRAAFQAVLMSASFRYLASPADADASIAQHALASRLSFMLIGEPPDAELRQLAAAGRLREGTTLDAQVERLCRDPRSQAFIRPFVTQWLELEQPITIAQDHIQKQDFRFARHLKASMREETILYVAQLVADNRPARELIESDWTMMNDTLASHYGYPALEGGHLRLVKLKADDHRGGGVLAHAGIQSMLCWMGDNWVIYRGAWALRHILDKPPPPPPLEVPELNPSEGKNKGKPFRELLKQHQADTRCAVCHRSIDPVGFAFQNFDLSGRWRALEHENYQRSELDGRIAWVGVGKTRPVDATGQLPRGETFKTFAEFKQVLLKHYQQDMVRGLVKNLVIYATGRKPSIDDLEEITRVLTDAQPRGYPLRDLIKAVVRSSAFLESNAPHPARKKP